ncbi:MAG TPA: acetate--CoA ligase family protein [Alphaproteobacteria bacterium]
MTAPATAPAEEAVRAAEARLAIVAARPDLAQALLRPQSVAIVGVGNDPATARGRPLHLLREHGFAGRVYPINSSRRVVQGAHAWPALATLPGPADQALILVGGDAAVDAVEACGRARIPVAVVHGALGGDDQARERLLAAARRHEVRVLGPGSSGIVVPAGGLSLTTDATFAARKPAMGRLMLLAEGGGAMGALFSRAAAREIGFASLISLGAVLDLSPGEIGELALDDPEIDVFLLFLDGLRHGAALARFAAKAHAAGKAVIAYRQPGPSAAGADPAAADAFLAAHGILRVDQFETLLELAPMMIRRRPARGRTAAIVSAADCAGAMVAERLARAGLAVAGLDDLARARLAQNGLELEPGRIADIPTSAPPDAVGAALNEALDAPNNEIVLAVLGAGAALDAEAAVAPIADAALRSDKPLAALVMPEAPEALRRLAAAGIGAFRTPEGAADGLRAFLAWSAPQSPALLWEDEPPPANQRVLHAGQAMQIFRLLGITIPTMLWIRRDTPLPKSLPFPPPYVAKVLSPDVLHRAEIGALALGVETVSALAYAIETMLINASIAAPDAFLDGVAIQRLEQGLAEVAIGFERDPEAGPVVTLTMGEGLDAVYGDRAVRLAPIDRAGAYAMIDEVKGLARIRGERNRPRGDLDALAGALVAMSSFALIAAPRVLAAAADPLLIRAEGQGVVALDGWMKTE